MHDHATSSILCMVALDHRSSFQRLLDRIGAESGEQRRRDLKRSIWHGVRSVLPGLPEQASPAILIDRGNRRVAAEAKAAGVLVALALEKSGCRTLHLDAATPVLSRELRSEQPGLGKALVRWNPDGSASNKRSQLAALRELDEVVANAGAELLLELLIRPRPPEAKAGPPARAWENTEMPELQRRSAEEILGSGISPALWKLEGHSNPEAAGRLCELVESARPDAAILILGGGADIAGLGRVFSCRAGNERVSGFAVGRSIWEEPIRALCAGGVCETEAQRAIGHNLLAVVEAFGSLERVPEGPC